MPLAFILLNSKVGTENVVLDKIKSLDPGKSINLINCSIIYGVYDLILKVEADNMDILKKYVTNKIRSLDEISSSLTLIEV
ncbi:MAG: Lrp/AsnC ligand binding domain-containing protein [Candidatus Hodarchaeales archaeon]|jgi:DNA-binding Lrp family transcriptional regulator